jgi:hypothetical protein
MGNTASFTTPSITTTFSGPAQPQSVFNELDELGLLLGQLRLPTERNPAYKQRLFRVFSQRANSTYQGLINGITRNLGLSLFDAISITPTETGGVFNATNPGIVINEAFVYLYSDVGTGALDLKIDRFDKTGSAFMIGDLVSSINASTFFTAAVLPGTNQYAPAMQILNQKSHFIITSETIPGSQRFQLGNTNIVKGTLFFSDRTIFRQEVSLEGSVTSSGLYWIDYKKGIVVTFSTASPNTSVRYEYIKSPMICRASPVIIHSIQDPDFKVKMFEQVLADDGTLIDGLVTPLGADLVNELISVFPGYWGE